MLSHFDLPRTRFSAGPNISFREIGSPVLGKKFWIITNDFSEYNKIIENQNQCSKTYSSYPEKIINLNKNWRRLKMNWYIIYCK